MCKDDDASADSKLQSAYSHVNWDEHWWHSGIVL